MNVNPIGTMIETNVLLSDELDCTVESAKLKIK